MPESSDGFADLQGIVREGLNPIRIPRIQTCSEWCEDNYILTPGTTHLPGPWRPYYYQPGMMDMMGHDGIEQFTCRKSARVGFTRAYLGHGLYKHVHKRRNSITYLPNDKLARQHVKARIEPALKDMPVLDGLVDDKKNTMQEFYIAGTALRVFGGHSANNYRAHDADDVGFDEIDGFNLDVEGEGSPIDLGRNRNRSSPRKKLICGSTPTTEGDSQLQKEERAADVRMRYMIPCPHCDHLQPLIWSGLLDEEERDYGLMYHVDPEDGVVASYHCRNCKCEIPYGQLAKLGKKGVWRTDDAEQEAPDEWIEFRNNKFYDQDGNVVATPKHVFIHIWSAYSLETNWYDICVNHYASRHDVAKLKTFFNTWLGEYWTNDMTKVEPEPLLERREPYQRNGVEVPKQVKVLTFGADVQGDRIECEVVGWGLGEESWSIDYQVFHGDPAGTEVWMEFGRYLKANRFKREDEFPDMKVSFGFVDSGSWTDSVYKFSVMAGRRFAMPCKGWNVYGKPVVSVPRRKDKEHRIYLAMIGTDTAKDILYNRLKMEIPGPGYCHFPDDDAIYDIEFFQQLTGEVKRLVENSGRYNVRYEKTRHDVEVLDCRIYAFAAVRYLQRRRIVKLFDNETIPIHQDDDEDFDA